MKVDSLTHTINRYIKEINKRITKRYLTIKGHIGNNVINSFWWNSEKNFGDLLVPLLLRVYGFTPIHTTIKQSDAVCIGSVLQWLDEDYDGYILGCGLLYETKMCFPNAKILALRGKLTWERLGKPKNVVLGDPGLLIGKLNITRKKKKFVIGLVPHYLDKTDGRLHNIRQRAPKDILLIDVQQNPIKTISEIDKCEYILSSSLHGIVASDALGIPNNWMLLSKKSTGMFKFHDYASVLKTIQNPCVLDGRESLSQLIKYTHSVSPQVEEVKIKLNCVYNKFSKNFKS